MKSAAKRARRLALVDRAKIDVAVPQTRDEKLAAALAWLGDKYVLSSDYSPRVRVGFFLNAWRAERIRAEHRP